MSDGSMIKIKPYEFVHILDRNDNIEKLVIGPKNFVLQEHEELISQISPMICLALNQYAVIKNPTFKTQANEVVFDNHGMAKLKHGEVEYRFHQEPFPLYPGEELDYVKEMETILPETGFVLEVLEDFIDESSRQRKAGELILLTGPKLYKPQKELKKVCQVAAQTIGLNEALRLKAIKDCTDSLGIKRTYGEEWLVKKPGSYIPSPYEQVVGLIQSTPITDTTALLMVAISTHTDDYGKMRKCGYQYLITSESTCSHIPNVHEEIVEIRNAIVLNKNQYCIIFDPVDEALVPQPGQKKIVKGEIKFFLQPGESLPGGIQNSYILEHDEALILLANDAYQDKKAGERWMIRGPLEYFPSVEVEVVERRKAIPLDSHEGIYIRNLKTGKIRMHCGETYILNEDEELWRKELTKDVMELLDIHPIIPICGEPTNVLDPLTKVISMRVTHNSAVQIYDYKNKKARVIFGPDYVMLGPDEEFTRLSLSGGKPKQPNMIKSLMILLGPDFSTDVVIVETADHARLSLKLSYNWHFEVKNKEDQVEASMLFAVPDFIGDMCKAIASRVRGSVASIPFDEFHKNSARVIRKAVFGVDEAGKIRGSFKFPQNNMVVTNIDVQSVEPVDQRTRDSLQKSVQLAIEITTNSQEASARQEAERLEQESRGLLERQKIVDQSKVEECRKRLIELQVESVSIDSCGQAMAEAQSKLIAAQIDGKSIIECAELKNKASEIEAKHEFIRLKEARDEELSYMRRTIDLELYKAERIKQLDCYKFDVMTESLGAQTLADIATSGHDSDVRLLESLGLQSSLITGSTPINLLVTANGLVSTAFSGSIK